jgi:hypothetical protein
MTAALSGTGIVVSEGGGGREGGGIEGGGIGGGAERCKYNPPNSQERMELRVWCLGSLPGVAFKDALVVCKEGALRLAAAAGDDADRGVFRSLLLMYSGG